ncbi:MAG TPA: hypothetical protein DCG38_11765, partial [Eubacteriaceae bacterium]|nr:hypothetical protein [Eubacteriaceae bacterium]
KKDIVMELKKEGFYVDKKVSKLITNLIMDYSEDKDERVKREMKKIAKYLKKVEEKVSQNKIIKEYRERGYRGRDKYLRGIAKEVIDEIV